MFYGTYYISYGNTVFPFKKQEPKVQKGVFVKSKLSFFAVIIAIFIAVFFNGCSTAAPAQSNIQNYGAFVEVPVPVKDFESKGMVFTEVQFTITGDGKINGKVFTYQELLKAAQKVGADAIVNVTIDRLVENVNEMSFSSNVTKNEKWYGSALAIKYTVAITQGGAGYSRERSFTGESSAPPEQPAGKTGFFK